MNVARALDALFRLHDNQKADSDEHDKGYYLANQDYLLFAHGI